MAYGDREFLGRVIPALLLTLGGIALWINYYEFLDKRRTSCKVSIWSRAGRLIKKHSIPLHQQKRKALAEVDDTKEDYLSQLPDDVLSSILARLALIDAVRTSILSTRWRYLFASMPTLKFRCLDMFGVHPHEHRCCPYYQHKFVKGVNQLLQLYSGRKVAHVEMTFCFGREFSSEFDQWMHSISRLGVERLSLYLDCGPNYDICNSSFRDPSKFLKFSLEPLSQASSLTHLFLYHCIIQPSFGVRLNSLTTLTLLDVLFACGQLEDIFSSCLNLNHLELEYCQLPYKLCISGTVASVVFSACGGLEEIDLRATNLRSFECRFFCEVRFFFSFVPVLKNVMIEIKGDAAIPYIFGDFARDLPNQVESLTVSIVHSQIKYFPTATQRFRNLRELTVVLVLTNDFDIDKISPLLGACPLLRYLDVVQSKTTRRGIRGSDIRPPLSPTYHTELKEVRFCGFHGKGEEIEFVVYILKSALVLELMFLSPCFTCYSGCGIWDQVWGVSLDESKRNTIQRQLHGQAISKNAAVIIQ